MFIHSFFINENCFSIDKAAYKMFVNRSHFLCEIISYLSQLKFLIKTIQLILLFITYRTACSMNSSSSLKFKYFYEIL